MTLTQERPAVENTVENVSTRTFDAWRLPWLRIEVAKLNKIAAKLSLDPITVVELSRETREERIGVWEFAATRKIEYVTVEIRGTVPVLPGGWQFVGAVEHLEAGNLVHGDDPAMGSYREAGADCEHCGFVRNRKKTVILRAEDGRIVQVGSTCLKDFLGYHGNPERVLDFVREVEGLCGDLDGEWRGPRGVQAESIDEFLAVVANLVRGNGFTPKSAYSGIPTAELVAWRFGYNGAPKPRSSKGENDQDIIDALDRAGKVTEADWAEGQLAKQWAIDLDPKGNDYLGNVKVVLAGSYVERKHFGIAASIISARKSDEDRAREKAEREGKRIASQYVGEIGDRINVVAKVTFLRNFGSFSYYGPDKFLVAMEDGAGNTVKTFNAGDFGAEVRVGDEVHIKGTVKEHSEYNGRKETMLTRVAVVEWLNRTAEEDVEDDES